VNVSIIVVNFAVWLFPSRSTNGWREVTETALAFVRRFTRT
jgi:hypothetical protein